jgi:hypothetical protein
MESFSAVLPFGHLLKISGAQSTALLNPSRQFVLFFVFFSDQ